MISTHKKSKKASMFQNINYYKHTEQNMISKLKNQKKLQRFEILTA